MHTGELAEIEFLSQLAERLRAAGHGTRSDLIKDARSHLGCSANTLYRKLKGVGYTSGRKLRSDRGDSRVSTEQVQEVSAMLMASQRATGKILLPMQETIDIALENGVLPEPVSPTTMLRLMRRQGCHPVQLQRASPHTQMRSLHPNHVWQLDASICVLYYLKNGRATVMDERMFNARKPENLARILNERVLRYAITDHYTGDTIARYYQTAGEDQRTLFDFLMWAFHAQPGRVMHGVPWMLVWDAGSANQSHGIKNLLTALGIRHWAHVPGNSRAKGQVETVHNVIERRFEGRLSFTSTESVEQLNARLDTWLRSFNGVSKHSRHGHTRDALWQTIRADQLRICPPVSTCAVLMHSKPETRIVSGNLTITFKPRGAERGTYSVADVPNVRAGEPVSVAINPYRSPAIYVIAQDQEGATRYFECDPLERDAAGFLTHAPVFGESYAAHADTDVDTARKEANQSSYGERDTGDALEAKKKGRVAFEGRIDPFKDVERKAAEAPAYMQRKGSDLHLPNPVQVEHKPMTVTDLLFALRTRLGRPIERAEAEAVQAWHPEGLPEDQFDALVQRVEQLNSAAVAPQPAAPRLVAVR